MKVIAINGSPHPQGNTFHALKNIGEELKKENIEFEILQVGSQNIHGCMGCNMCFRNKNEKCVITTDSFNELLQKIKDVDGIILGYRSFFRYRRNHEMLSRPGILRFRG